MIPEMTVHTFSYIYIMYGYYFIHDIKPTPFFSFQEVEAILFAVTALAENVDSEEGVCLPSLFNMLSQIPCTHEKLVSQALYLIGRSSYRKHYLQSSTIQSKIFNLIYRPIIKKENGRSSINE